jgi:hypothetical protein
MDRLTSVTHVTLVTVWQYAAKNFPSLVVLVAVLYA